MATTKEYKAPQKTLKSLGFTFEKDAWYDWEYQESVSEYRKTVKHITLSYCPEHKDHKWYISIHDSEYAKVKVERQDDIDRILSMFIT
jgi:hypothetical protein